MSILVRKLVMKKKDVLMYHLVLRTKASYGNHVPGSDIWNCFGIFLEFSQIIITLL